MILANKSCAAVMESKQAKHTYLEGKANIHPAFRKTNSDNNCFMLIFFWFNCNFTSKILPIFKNDLFILKFIRYRLSFIFLN